jgi:hypothetical protein
MDEKAIKLETRLSAIEYMIGQLYKVIYGLLGATPEMIEASQADLRRTLQYQTFGTDPAKSDLAAAEMQEAVDRLLDLIAEMSGVVKKR